MAQVTIREGLDGASVPDSYMDSDNPTTNFGAITLMNVGFNSGSGAIWRPLLKFPLGNLPSGAIVTAAKMTINILSAAPTADAAKVRRLTQSNWVEADVTWNEYSAGNNWSSAGGDFVTDDEVDFSLPTATGDFDITGLKVLVEDARANRSDDLHILLMRATESGATANANIWSGEYGTAGSRPRLIIDYLLEDRMEPMNKLRSRIPMVRRRTPIVGTVL